MLKRLWQWLKRFIQRLLSSKQTFSPPLVEKETRKPRKQLTDTEYESLFLQLTVTRDELLVILQPDANLVQQLAQQLGIETSDPQIIIEALISQIDAGELPTDDAEAWVKKGISEYESGDFEGAIAYWDIALVLKPDYHRAWYSRGIMLDKLGRYEQAIASYNKALVLKPDFHDAWYNRGFALANLGQYEKALASYDKALEFKPDDDLVWYTRGIALHDLGRYEQALASYDKALELKPDFHDAWYNRGNALANLGQYEKALASYDKALELKPDEHVCWNNRGNALGNLGRYEQALASFDKALELKLDYHDAWNNRGVALQNLGRYKQALASFDKALELKLDYHNAWNNRGVVLLRNLGRYEQALASFDKALELNPDDHDAWNNRGNTLHNLGRYEQALASYDKALELKPDDHDAWNNRGVALRNLGRYEQALASYDKALELKLDYHSAWNNRGDALHNLGRYEQALASYDKALELNPDKHHAWNNRGVALRILGRYEQALASFDKALELKPDEHDAWNNRGDALHNLGRYEQALASFDKALELNPDKHHAWNNRGIAAGQSVSCDRLWASLSVIARKNPALNQRGYEGSLASYEEGLKYCHQDTHPEGWGVLHRAIGQAHYFQGHRDSYPRPYWYKAVHSYNEALKTLTEADFPEWHLEVLQDLVRVQLDLQEIAKAEELQRRGTDLLRRLLDDCDSPRKKQQLALKFAGFQQLTVDLAVQSGQLVEAIELAEQGKNACLRWLLDGWINDISSPSYSAMQQLLNPTTAIVYWHLSPYSLQTFILKHDLSEPRFLGETGVLNQARRLRDFEDWRENWNKQYADYGKGKDQQGESERTWRDNLPEMLRRLGDILDINAVVSEIPEITQLILIPHRDLHRFPLHTLFPNNFSITYLPSAQIGLISPTTLKKAGDEFYQLLSIEHPNSKGLDSLEFAQVESQAIRRMFPHHTRLRSEEATNEAVITALPQGYDIFHFTGHGTYNFQNPALSYLALAGEDHLTVADIRDLDLRSYQLVSLAACETAITGNHTITTEYVGLVSGFMGCGVGHVVSTLWTVESAVSALVMMEFYQLLQQGKSETVALAEATQWLRNVTNAQLAEWYAVEIEKLPEDEGLVRRFLSRHLNNIKNTPELSNKPYNHPYFWAAFTITGIFPSCNQ